MQIAYNSLYYHGDSMKTEETLLYSSFLQIKGISREKEAKLWASGIDTLEKLHLSMGQQQSLFYNPNNEINLSIQALKDEDLSFFLKKLEQKDYYRIAYSFPAKVMFLDIETTGLSKQYHYVTMVGWMIDGKYDYWLQGTPTKKLFDAVKTAELLITYNGIMFDCKFLDCALKTNIFSSKPNLDLMHLCRRYDQIGGQKKIEDSIGFLRPQSLQNTNGKEAIALWYEFLFGDNRALSKLILYNYFDVQGMAYILDWVFFEKIHGILFPKTKQCHPHRFYKVNNNEVISYPTDSLCAHIRKCVKTSISNFDRDKLSASTPFRIVGIDLAGKVSSRTGMCLLQNDQAETTVLHEDKDIIEYVVSCKPDLISIDAPLSLPKGRTTVYDDDPNRDLGGILRYSERMLKKRNINSYPALIRSMQELTKRGIELSSTFRSLGFPVIECFPGAAQDIIQLPRKRTDEALLKKGLCRYGIHGPFEHKKVYHDELDAITASIVGQFFISGYYEPLGIPDENYMIIPQKTYRECSYKTVIGICGPISAGKTEVSHYISSKGFQYVRYSHVLAQDMLDRAKSVDRASLQSLGWDVYSSQNQYKLNNRLKEYLHSFSHIVIDGMRHMEDFTFWKELCFNSFYLIYIDADYSNRESRYIKKQDVSVKYSDALSHPVESHIPSLHSKADFIIKNNGTEDELYKQVDNVLMEIMK